MSNKNKYLKMFETPYFKALQGDDLEDARAEIKWAREFLKKEDRIIWYLRLYKYEKINHFAQNCKYNERLDRNSYKGNDISKDMKFYDMMERKECTTEGFGISEINRNLQHMYDLDLYHINNMNLGWDSPKRIFDQSEDYERSWIAENEGKSNAEYGTKIVEFADGSAWFDLEVSGCELEGSGMGHCGNGSHNEYSDERVLSFRRPAPVLEGESQEKRWISYLTFIVNTKTGDLGEMKGRGNSRPAARYHDAIISLLKTEDRIKKVVGGGYKAENNFSLDDLDKDKYDQLMEEKPSLFSIFELYDQYGLVDSIGDYKFSDVVESALNTEGKINIDGESHYLVWSAIDLEDLAKEFNLKTLSNFQSTITEGFSDHFDFDSDWTTYHDDYAESSLKEWSKENPSDFSRMQEFLTKTYGEEINDNDWDVSDISDIISLCKQEDGNFISEAFCSAAFSGNERGYYDDMYDSFNGLIADFAKDARFKLIENKDNPYHYDLAITAKDFFDFYEDNKELLCEEVMDNGLGEMDAIQELITSHELVEANDLDEPQYGYNGFCNDTFKESFKSRINDSINENCPPRITCEPFGEPGVMPRSIINKQYEEQVPGM